MANWQPIPGFSDYEINEAGAVVCTADHYLHTGRRLLSQHVQNGVYHVYLVSDAGRRVKVAVRSLVLLAFRGEKAAGTRIIHRDGDSSNHCLANLEYATLKGLLPKARKGYAKKLSPQDVSEIRRLLAAGDTVRRRIAEQFGIDPSMITMIGNGKRHNDSLRRLGAEEV